MVQAEDDGSHLLLAAMPRAGLPFPNRVSKIDRRLAGQVRRRVAFAAAVRTVTVCTGLQLLRFIADANQQTAALQLSGSRISRLRRVHSGLRRKERGNI